MKPEDVPNVIVAILVCVGILTALLYAVVHVILWVVQRAARNCYDLLGHEEGFAVIKAENGNCAIRVWAPGAKESSTPIYTCEHPSFPHCINAVTQFLKQRKNIQ